MNIPSGGFIVSGINSSAGIGTQMTDIEAYLGDQQGDLAALKRIIAEVIDHSAEVMNMLDEKERELNLLYTVIRKITFSMDWDEIGEKVVELISEFFRVVKFCLIGVYGLHDELILNYVSSGQSQDIVSVNLKMDIPINDSTRWDEIIVSDVWNTYFEQLEPVRNMELSFIPLSAKDREFGFLMVGKNRNREYAQGEWRFLSTIAHYVSVTLDNSLLYQLARTDALTGIFNRRYFEQRLTREAQRSHYRATSFGVIILDIDRFKSVNDTYGHPAGDQVLIALASRLQATLSENEQLFRIGGEEMAIISSGLSPDSAFDRAEAFRVAIQSSPFTITAADGDVSLPVTISLGVALHPQHSPDPQTLITLADQALYFAKENGRNRSHVYRR